MSDSTSRLLFLGSAITLAWVAASSPLPAIAQAGTRAPIDEQALRQDMQRAIDQRRRELLPEYQRRVRTDGRASADAWLRATAERLGREDGDRVRRRHEAGAYVVDTPRTSRGPAADARGEAGTARRKGKGKDPECARIVTRQRNVPSVSGGAMQMIMVTECVPAR